MTISLPSQGLVQGLILHGPPLLTTDEQKKQVREMYSTPEFSSDGAHIQAIWDRIRSKDSSIPLELSHRETLLSLQAGANYVAGYTAVADLDLETILEEISVPVLILAGGKDSLKACVEPTAERLKNAESCTVRWLPEDAGTYACDTHPGAVCGAIADWMKETKLGTRESYVHVAKHP